jgi:hypothetical protein
MYLKRLKSEYYSDFLITEAVQVVREFISRWS